MVWGTIKIGLASMVGYNSHIILYNINLQTSIIKKSIMTMPYNVSAIQSIRYLKDNFIEDLDYTNLQNNKDNNLTKGKWLRHIKDENLYLKDLFLYIQYFHYLILHYYLIL